MQDLHKLTDEELLARVSDDPETFGVFYDRHATRLLGILRHRCGSTEVAVDLAGEVFAATLESCARFSARQSGSAQAWLYAIARNKLADYFRAQAVEDRVRRNLAMQPVVVTDEGLEVLERRLEAETSRVEEAMGLLPPDERGAVEARVLQEEGYADMAERFDTSQSVMRQRVSRGLRRLRSLTREET